MYRASVDQTIALAGVFQAAALVEQIARQGLVAQDALQGSIASLFVTNPKATEDVFGGRDQLKYNLSTGLKELQKTIDKKGSTLTPNITRYALSMIALERKLQKNPQFLNTIGERLEQLEQKANYFFNTQNGEDPADYPSRYTHSAIIGGLDQLYKDTVSQFSFRIQVQGDPRQLQNDDNAARIRALLLSGIRAAMLWRQVGGHRWHFLFLRARLRDGLKQLT
ncbi:MAG TPA: high frequency lysogenization protein HflD [Marinobacterium sp.]|nr:high frequency lysogenization protein HflD [Marinobacterium sp.]